MSQLQRRISAEIEALHSFLSHWLNGTLSKSDDVFSAGIQDRLSNSFHNIQPAGLLLGREQLLSQIHQGYARSPGFKIKIRNVRLLNTLSEDRFIIAVYEEYQKNARNSERKNNARLSTVAFENRENSILNWLYIHETWLPAECHSESMFEF